MPRQGGFTVLVIAFVFVTLPCRLFAPRPTPTPLATLVTAPPVATPDTAALQAYAEWLVVTDNEYQAAVARWGQLWGPAYSQAKEGAAEDTIDDLESVCATAEALFEEATNWRLVHTAHWDL